MTKIKFCGLTRPCDIEAANELKPEYIGFVFVQGRKRYISPEQAASLKRMLSPGIKAVGVFIDEKPENVAKLLAQGIIDIAQLHGSESEAYIRDLRRMSLKPVIRAFQVSSPHDIAKARDCTADYVLLDSGAGTGTVFDWELIKSIQRPYFLAGGLGPHNIREALSRLTPFAVDVSSGIETGGVKDREKMAAFVSAVRKEEKYDEP